MSKTFLPQAKQYTKQNKRRSVWRKIVQVMACFVVFCTTYALILPAITMEKVECGLDEHIHTESCYQKVAPTVLACTYTSLGVHQHAAECYDESGELICTQADYLIHTHDASCTDAEGNLQCQLPAVSAHVHTDACYETAEAQPAAATAEETESVHSHTDTCYTSGRGALTCQLTEQLGHTHGENCSETVLVCELTEESHIHGDACYQTNSLCELPETEGHTHTDACYETVSVLTCEPEDGTALATDAEAERVLICTEPVVPEHIHGEACFVEVTVEEDPLTCTLTECHAHSAQCYDENSELICTLEPTHTHSDSCYDGNGELICPEAEGHIHSAMCYGTWQLICDKEVHTHTDACIALTEEEQAQVNAVIAQIDQMPSSDEIDEAMIALEESGDLTGLDVYYEEISAKVNEIYAHYAALTDVQKAHVTNADKLLALEYMWAEMEDASTYVTNIQGYNMNANNIIPVDGYLGVDAGYAADGVNKGKWASHTKQVLAKCNVIFVNLPKHDGVNRVNIGTFLLGNNWKTLIEKKTEQGLFSVNLYNDWCAIRVEPSTTYPFYVAEQIIINDSEVQRIGRITHVSDKGYVVLVRRDFIDKKGYYMPEKSADKFALVHMNKELLWTKEKQKDFIEDPGWLPGDTASTDPNKLGPFAYMTLSPLNPDYDDDARAGVRSDDLPVVNNIKFKLFDYSEHINKTKQDNNDSSYRALASYFYFRGGIDKNANRDYYLDVAKHTPNVNPTGQDGSGHATYGQDGSGHATYDQDGYTANHARVEPNLWNGYPILDFTVDANGNAVTPPSGWGTGKMLNPRSLRFLFDQDYAYGYAWTDKHKIATGAVTEYSPKNTILQFNPDTHTYWYDSSKNAVDYDIDAQLFRVRKYTERTSITADWLFGEVPPNTGDFLPFNYSNGIVNATYHSGAEIGASAVMDSSFPMDKVNYWFGMSMEFTFIQGEDGTVTYTDSKGVKRTDVMNFHFSGDDDVWVFIDGVRILDLGGTHGSVTGDINFKTGKVTQKMTWEDDPNKSYPTTLKKCFDLAGKTPKGGWDNDGAGTPGNRFADYTIHTLKFFYLERGTAVANCAMSFNMPNFDNPLIVGKTLNPKDADTNLDALEYLRDTTEYSFRILETDANGNVKTGADGNPVLFMKPGQKYSVVEYFQTQTLAVDDVSTPGTTYQIGDDGIFKLKHGQQAVFEDVLATAGYSDKYFVVQELLPDNQVGHYNTVQYTIEAQGGLTVSDDAEDLANFAGFYSPKISAGEPQHVQFINEVDTETLSVMKVSKQITEGSSFAADQEFTMKIKLDDELLPVGTKYKIGETEYEMTEAGTVKLKAGETAEMLVLALAGTTYEVLEENGGNWVINYTSVTTDKDGNETTASGNTGNFPMDSTVHVTVTNSTYQYRIPFTFTKQIFGTTDDSTFKFTIAEWDMEKDAATTSTGVGFTPTDEISLKVTSDKASKTVYFIFGSEAAYGDYWFKISEATATKWYENATAYFVHVTLSEDGAEVVGVKKNKVTAEETAMPYDTIFKNYRLSTLKIQKLVDGSPASQDKEYSFKLVFEKGSSALKPTALSIRGRKYDAEGNLIETLDYATKATWEFTLKHGEYIVFNNLTTGLKWTVTETSSEEYRAAWEITEGKTTGSGEGYVSSDTLKQDANTVVYTNTSTYKLPETGGAGTQPYAIGGLLLSAAAILLYIHNERRRKEDYSSSF